MRVLMLSKACVVGAYQRKLEELAACPAVELTAVVPPGWRDERGWLPLERAHTRGYDLRVEPLWWNGNFHLHFYPQLPGLIARLRPQVVHLDEEPYNLATWLALRAARRVGAKTLFFSWQNLLRPYPFPFSAFERDVLRHVDYALVGNRESEQVWRAKGYRGPLAVIPQFGVDPEIFAPTGIPHSGFVVGYAGRLVPEKGVDDLLRAVAQLPAEAQLRIVGAGPEQRHLQNLARELGLEARCAFGPPLPSTQMPRFLGAIDVFVLPSRTRPNWKEQFGRVLIEAMACGVPVIGSTCGEIPNVLAETGVVYPEGDVAALAEALHQLAIDPARRAQLAHAGRERVWAHYTQRQVARATVAVYRAMLGPSC
jgi:glycosyltransferase involved in cell wall biosynthesis